MYGNPKKKVSKADDFGFFYSSGESKNSVADKLEKFRYTVNNNIFPVAGDKPKHINTWFFDGFQIVTEDYVIFSKTDYRTVKSIDSEAVYKWNQEQLKWNQGQLKWNF
jgi:hypothetical protein